MEIKDRLRMIIQSHGLTAGEFADRIGVQRSNVSHILNGRNKPGFEFLEKVVTNFPRVQAHWLLTGSNKQDVSQEETTKVEKTTAVPVSKEVPAETKEQRHIVRIVTFYDDKTFEVSLPNAE